MKSWKSIAVRSLFLIGFIVALPLLALPRAARLFDELLYGKSQPLPVTRPKDNTSSAAPHSAGGPVARATFEEPVSKSSPLKRKTRQPHEGIDGAAPEPPRLELAPEFAAPPPSATSDLIARVAGGPGAARIRAIREKLETLGADYVVLDSANGAFRFHCEFPVSAPDAAPGGGDAPQRQQFEKQAADPVAAAEAVLTQAQAWSQKRTARVTPPRYNRK